MPDVLCPPKARGERCFLPTERGLALVESREHDDPTPASNNITRRETMRIRPPRLILALAIAAFPAAAFA